ncbi:hypothetical protein CLAFUW4_00546 [Fulvia fulva]|uniref:Apple domain-containing protein n=1 Tax=Passalora fulva TaxID=5499 RepID=A0A9Q8L683_PASFU|nr:uncharacterized protein CLAFUR5_00546 [Fulvia fulva]KAK4636036.1 hypothetical protein CLAFUR4_00547 [Fulvia fulva]KAK4637498.1 hypothetical protein CLAFUR0_00548 [Fulvia fulva]UJO11617.1 hypothetical protein CLAFUR5_00546 [Fulvia fulva]WPV10228.1 hypothetical protein CLAFUW4_00546 [Fulvia fulva]WPV23681.1 hypothetical protein CLAFUW7_00551 [Fulvia fulva]
MAIMQPSAHDQIEHIALTNKASATKQRLLGTQATQYSTHYANIEHLRCVRQLDKIYHPPHQLMASKRDTMSSFTNILLALATLTPLADVSASAVPDTLVKRADLECPSSNGTEYLTNSGYNFRIRCNSDTRSNGYWGLTTTQTFDECLRTCGGLPRCNYVTYTGRSVDTYGSCYLKEDNGGSYVSANNVYVARKLNPAYCQ